MSEEIRRQFTIISKGVKTKQMRLNEVEAQMTSSGVVTDSNHLELQLYLQYVEEKEQQIDELKQNWGTLIDNIDDDAARVAEGNMYNHWMKTRDDDNPGFDQTLKILRSMGLMAWRRLYPDRWIIRKLVNSDERQSFMATTQTSETVVSKEDWKPENLPKKPNKETVEETDIKNDSNVLMDKKKNPAVNKAEKHWKKFKKKNEKEFGKFKQAWKKKHQHLMLKLKKYEQQVVIFNKKLKENQDDMIQAAETWKMEKESWTKLKDDLKAKNQALKAEIQAWKRESNVKNTSLTIQKLENLKLDESKRDYAARKPTMKQQ
uniref:Uncharacterized protein n=1 Tax=Panagrolaimus sp. JU765 TaxID=591449 RepID=A0AC34R332_9BILA